MRDADFQLLAALGTRETDFVRGGRIRISVTSFPDPLSGFEHGRDQRFRIEGLGDIGVGSDAVCQVARIIAIDRRQDDDGNIAVLTFHPFADFVARHAVRQDEIQQHGVGHPHHERGVSLSTIAGDFGSKAFRSEKRLQKFGLVPVIFNDEHAMDDQISSDAVRHRNW